MTSEINLVSTDRPRGRAPLPRAILFVGIGLLALVGVAIVAAAVLSRPVDHYPADSPEGTFQRYLNAHEEDRVDEAYGFFSARVQRTMSLENYRRATWDQARYQEDGHRLVLHEVDVRGERATLHVRVEESDGGLFGGGYEWDEQIRMVREDGEWRVDSLLVGMMPFEDWHSEEWDEEGS
jgi:hypothetical protein